MPTYQLPLDYNNTDLINDRKSICLDTNVWIDIAESNQPLVLELRSKLKELISDGKVFCPLVLDVFMEFHRQNYESISRLFQVINDLTLNLSLNQIDYLYRFEVINFLNNLINNEDDKIPVNEIFVPFAAVGRKTIDYNFPYSFKNPKTPYFFREFHDKIINWKFSEYITHLKSLLPQKYDIGNGNFQETFKIRKDKTKGDKTKMYLMEEEHFINKTIKPIIGEELKKIILSTGYQWTKEKFLSLIDYFRDENISPSEKGFQIAREIISKYPACKNTLEVITFCGYDTNRKSKESDHSDIMLMIYATSYCDVLVTRDKWINGLLSGNRDTLLTNTIVINEFEVFLEYLSSL